MPQGSPCQGSTRAAPVTFLLDVAEHPASGGCSAVLCRACLQGASRAPQGAAHAGLCPPRRSSSGRWEQPRRGHQDSRRHWYAQRACVGQPGLVSGDRGFLASQCLFLHPQPSISAGFCQGRANAQQQQPQQLCFCRTKRFAR